MRQSTTLAPGIFSDRFHSPDKSDLSEFASLYYGLTDPVEMQTLGVDTLFAMASSHWTLLNQMADSNGVRFRVFNPTMADDGFVSEHTIIQIVHSDMPFLVDSVTMAVNRSGRMVHWIVHPLMQLTRDDQGNVTQFALATPDAQNRPISSLIMLVCDRIGAADDRQQLASNIGQVLADVRSVVNDWSPMLARLKACQSELASHQAPDHSVQQGQDFLSWLEAQNFTFLGVRDYHLNRDASGVRLSAVPDSGLGILHGDARTPDSPLHAAALSMVDSTQVVWLTKALTRATVHRPALLDCVSVKRTDAHGQVLGETRFLGLYTSKAYAASVLDIPLIQQRVAAVVSDSHTLPESHAAKALMSILVSYPRDELFQADHHTLLTHAVGILRLQERQRTRVFFRHDPFDRFTSVQVFVPRDVYTTELRIKIGQELMRAFAGQTLEFTPTLTENPLARIHYLVHGLPSPRPAVDEAALETRIVKLAQRWEDQCQQALVAIHGESTGFALTERYAKAFPNAYRDDFSAAVAAQDIQVLTTLSLQLPVAVRLYRPLDAISGSARFKLFSLNKVALSDSLPILERMGARVIDEHPYALRHPTHDGTYWLHDLGLQLPPDADLSAVRDRFEHLFLQVWHAQVDSDDLNKLVLSTSLDARSIAILRAYARYFKQLGLAFSQSYLESTLCKNPRLTQSLFQLFDTRFNPAHEADRADRQASLNASIEFQLTSVVSLDEDRILRQFHRTILATCRTNVWQTTQGANKPCISFKLDPRAVPGVPEPKPLFEIWVYSPRVEGIHLRGGKVARGGIRWSDRREDFRTEILGLVKAQQVKNTVIVPVGSKGGFVLKNATPPGDREALMAEGIACYKLFLSGLLDLTDNIVKGQVVPPAQVVRHDPDDPYLVVAADKGTASFSDIANSVSAEYGFWLGDAFASGGSVGYDHKKMGITARGAWESAKRHFRTLSRNIQTHPVTVVGIGDMSGDVFGNGMLLSRQTQLVAAFDHRHIFIDPHPDAQRSFEERQRLFQLPRSSWDDFDRSLMSAGSGVYPRAAKSITLSDAACQVLGIDNPTLTPNELLCALLQAPVDMIYNGGIGTYVKSSAETHAQVGDKAGDAFRVNGQQLRCKVLVEGGNLGCTQLGRIEYAQTGGRIYTDAIDNSAGVDCSDHEVNIKILLDRVVDAGDLTLKQRNDLLASMTDEVGLLVLADNYHQTQAIDVACHQPLRVLSGQQRLMQWLEGAGRLNRAIEFMPTDDDIQRRRMRHQGLTAPEGAVLLAYAKMAVFDDLVASNLPDDPYFSTALQTYFPKALTQQFAPAIDQHPLKREIIATHVTNVVINRTGATFINFLAAEAAASTADVVRAFTLAREIFDLEPLWAQIDALDNLVPSSLQCDLLGQLIAVAQRASRWLLRGRFKATDLPTLIARYQPGARALRSALLTWLPESARLRWANASHALVGTGVPEDLAHHLTALEFMFPALDLVDLAERGQTTLEAAAQAYYGLDQRLGLSQWRTQINRLPTDTLWQTQARGSARDDIDAIAGHITLAVLSGGGVEAWADQHAPVVERLARLRQVVSDTPIDLAPVSVALRELRQLA